MLEVESPGINGIAFSDAQFKKTMELPQSQETMKLAAISQAEITKPLPLYEIKSARDPWVLFREAGRKPSHTVVRVTKRNREDETEPLAEISQNLVEAETPLRATSVWNDPNDVEFTNPPW